MPQYKTRNAHNKWARADIKKRKSLPGGQLLLKRNLELNIESNKLKW